MDSLRKLQLCELEILKKFKEICESNNLTYYLSGGTLLGAVRHKGFIPWDDDVDVAMPRPDYKKFIEIAKSEFSVPPYSIVTYETDSSYFLPFAKIMDERIKLKESILKESRIVNCWIDVFPLEAFPTNKIRFILRKYHLIYRKTMYKLSAFDDVVRVNAEGRSKTEKLLIEFGSKIHLSKYMNAKKQIDKYNHALDQYPFDAGDYIVNLMGIYGFKSLMKKEIYGKKTELQFENEYFRVPEQYDLYLRRIYGDYMTPPPENARNHHSTEIIECAVGEDELL